MERFELHIEAESRIRWKVYVRFGGEFSETDHSNMARRRLLSLHFIAKEGMCNKSCYFNIHKDINKYQIEKIKCEF